MFLKRTVARTVFNNKYISQFTEYFGQVFLHYNNVETKGSKENIYDRRPHLRLPTWFKK